MANRNERHTTHKNKGGIEVLIVLPDIFGVVFCRLFLVHCVEIETNVIVLNGFGERPKGILRTEFVQWVARR